MNCKQAQLDIALLVGQDLDDPRGRDDVKRHVATCPDCRQHYRRMKGAIKVLGQADAPETYTVTGSLWPELATRISDRSSAGPRGRFNGWVPFVAMTAACMTLMLVVNEHQQPQGSIGPQISKGLSTIPVLNEFDAFRDDSRPQLVPFDQRSRGDDMRELQRDRLHE